MEIILHIEDEDVIRQLKAQLGMTEETERNPLFMIRNEEDMITYLKSLPRWITYDRVKSIMGGFEKRQFVSWKLRQRVNGAGKTEVLTSELFNKFFWKYNAGTGRMRARKKPKEFIESKTPARHIEVNL